MKTVITFKVILMQLLGCFLFCSTACGQTLLLEEDFDFLPGTDLVGQNDWSLETAGTNRIVVSETGLTYPGYPNLTGRAITCIPLTDRVQKRFIGTRTGAYYYSFLINVSSAGSGEFFAGFFSSNAFRSRVYLKADGDGFQFGLLRNTGGTLTYTTGAPYTYGTTYLAVVKNEFVPGDNNDKVSLYINPDLSGDEPDVPLIGPLTDSGGDLTANVFAIQGRNNSGTFALDGVRITTDWESLSGRLSEKHTMELPLCIGSHMVVQRDTPMKLWGWGTPGDVVEATFTRDGTHYEGSATIDEDGRWLLRLSAQVVCTTPCELKIGLKDYPETLRTFDNILVGDVWLAAGQSNMEKRVNHLTEAAEYIEEADNYQQIRAFRTTYNAQTKPDERVNGSSTPWVVCNSEKVGDNVSAVAYVFARDIYDEVKVPIGIMQAYRGGIEIETLISPWKYDEPEYCKIKGRKDFLSASTASNYHSLHFNGQIYPLVNYPIKGFLFYQGESNNKRATEYRYMMKMLIEDWRERWGLGELPFYYIQMFNVNPAKVYEEGTWPDIREQQSFLLLDKSVPNTGMAVIIDTNEDPTNSNESIRMHPQNKKPVGQRIARVALRDTYGVDLPAEGPVLNRYRFESDGSVFLYFRNYGSGLKVKGGDTELKGFAISADDKKFKTAVATITNDSTIVVSHADITEPVAVRYAWARNPICNLYNSIDIPMNPFRTDMWALTSYDQPQTSCTEKSSDASLLAIKVNGLVLHNFEPEQLNYTIAWDNPDVYPQILAITQSPFAKLVVTEDKVGKQIAITVTAENGIEQTYKLNLEVATSLGRDLKSKVRVYKEGSAVVVNNESGDTCSISIYNALGQCMVEDSVEINEIRRYRLSAGIYVLRMDRGIIKFWV